MLQSNPEAAGQAPEEHFSLYLASPADKDIFREWLDLRQAYVERQGWHYGDDRDDYDDNPETRHILLRKGGEVYAGMRLAPVADPKETLSWSMLTPDMQQEALSNLPEPTGEQVWDLTRLVTNGADRQEAVEVLVQLLAAGLKLSREQSPHPRWFFTTTQQVFSFFKRQGIEFTPLVRGKINPDDKDESVFCYTDPVARVEWAREQAATHKHMYQAALKVWKLTESQEES